MSERIMKALANCEQGLTEEQKLQARTNIGAIGGVYVHDAGGTNPLTPDENGYVTIDLTDAGKSQSDWDEANPVEPSYIRNKPDLSQFATKDELDGKQDVLEAGDNIIIEGNTISATAEPQQQADWSQTNSQAADYIKNKPDLSQFATKDELDGKQDVLEAGDNIIIEGNTISATAEPQQQADWAQTDTEAVDYIKNKPTIPAAQVQSDWVQTNSQAVDYIKNKPTIPAAQVQSDWAQTNSQAVDYIKHKPTIPAAQAQSDWAQTDTEAVDYIKNKPTLSAVAESGDYDDLTNKPTIPAPQVQSDWAQTNSQAVDYIKHKPIIPAAQVQSDWSQTNSQAADYIKNKPSIPAAQVQSDWSQTNSQAADYIKNKPAAMETKPLVAGTNIEFVSDADKVTINSSGTKIVKRSNPYSSDVPVTEMAIYDPNEDYGALVRDQNGNTIGYLAPKHYGNNDKGKVLTVVNDNGYKLEWRPQGGGSSDLKLLTEVTQNVDGGAGAYQLTVVDGNAYTLNMLVDREVQLITNSTETVHTRIAIHNDGDNVCGGCYLTWRDEALVQHRIYLMLYNVSSNVEYFFDVYIKKVVVNGTPYAIARVTDFPCAYRNGYEDGYTTNNINFIGRDY